MNRSDIINRLRQPRYFIPIGLAGLAAIAGLAGLFTFYAGYVVGRYEIGPFETAQRGEYKLFGASFEQAGKDSAVADWGEQTTRLYSIFIDVDVESVRLDLPEQRGGGGMTSFGDAVLLVTQRGDIFSIRGADDIRRTKIAVPDNGFEGYRRAAAEQFADYTHNFHQFRYNDITHFHSGDMRGLALSYTEWDADGLCYRNAVAILEVPQAAAAIEEISAEAGDWDIVFRAEPCLPLKKRYRAMEGLGAGGRMVFRAPNILYVASGDYLWDGVYASKAVAQDPEYDYGKVIELDLAAGTARAITRGHRNVQGMVLDPEGRLWATEHGMRGGDELNLIREGRNYGWPVETYGTQYTGFSMPNVLSYGRHDTHTAPVFAWLPSVATSAVTLVDGFHESWDGDLLMGGLGSKNLYHIRIRDERVVFTERIPVGQRIRYVHQHDDGRILLWTDDHYVVFLTPAQDDATQTFIKDYIAAAPVDSALKTKLADAVAACQMCHSFRAERHLTGPGLGAVADAPVAGAAWDGYSPALRNMNGVWSEEALVAYINAPSDFAPGTTMPDPGLDDPLVQREVAKLLSALKNNNGDAPRHSPQRF